MLCKKGRNPAPAGPPLMPLPCGAGCCAYPFIAAGHIPQEPHGVHTFAGVNHCRHVGGSISDPAHHQHTIGIASASEPVRAGKQHYEQQQCMHWMLQQHRCPAAETTEVVVLCTPARS